MSLARTNWTGIAFGLCLASLAAYQQFKLPPALPVLLQTYGTDRTLAGAYMSVYAVAGLFLSWWIGRRLAHRGLTGAILTALGIMIAGSVITLLRPDLGWLVLAARGLEGIGFAVLAIAGPVLANGNAAARHLPLVASLTASWIPIGQLAAIGLAPVAFAVADWRALWWVAIVASLALGLWTLALRFNRRVGLAASRPPGGGAPPAAALSRAERRNLRIAALVFMLWSGQYFAYMTWLPQYLVESHGFSPSGAAAGTIIPVAVLIASNLATGQILRAGVPVGQLLAVGLASQALVWWLLPVTGGGIGGLASLVIYGLGAGICPTCLFAMPSVVVGAGRGTAAAFGIIMTGRNLGVLMGPVVLAQAFKLFGGWWLAGPLFGAWTSLALAIGVWLAISLGGARYGTRR